MVAEQTEFVAHNRLFAARCLQASSIVSVTSSARKFVRSFQAMM
jgi:hypothetical protein